MQAPDKDMSPFLYLRFGGGCSLLLGSLALYFTSGIDHYLHIDMSEKSHAYLCVMSFFACAMMLFGYFSIRARYLGALGLLVLGVSLVGIGEIDSIMYHHHPHDVELFPDPDDTINYGSGPFYIVLGLLFLGAAMQGIVNKGRLRWF